MSYTSLWSLRIYFTVVCAVILGWLSYLFFASNSFQCNNVELSGTHTDSYPHQDVSQELPDTSETQGGGKCWLIDLCGFPALAPFQIPVYPAVHIPWNNAQWHAGMQSSAGLATYNLVCPLLQNWKADAALETSVLDVKGIDGQGLVGSALFLTWILLCLPFCVFLSPSLKHALCMIMHTCFGMRNLLNLAWWDQRMKCSYRCWGSWWGHINSEL